MGGGLTKNPKINKWGDYFLELTNKGRGEFKPGEYVRILAAFIFYFLRFS